MSCAVCHKKEATQDHHIRYDPEITIAICVSCHKWLHNYEHGVGRGRLPISSYKELQQLEPPEFVESHFHYITREERIFEGGTFEVDIINSKSTDEELGKVICEYCRKHNWGIYFEESTKIMYLICLYCRSDKEIEQVG